MTTGLAVEPDDHTGLLEALQPGLYLVPESGCPPEYAGLPIQELLARIDAQERERATGQESPPAGSRRRTPPAQPAPNPGSGSGAQPGINLAASGPGLAFESGGPLDTSAPDGFLAVLTDAVTRGGGLAGRTDDELIGVMRAWQRLESWCASGVLTAIAELARRRPAGKTPPAPPGQFPAQISEFVVDEVAAALTLTHRATDRLYAVSLDLEMRLPVTARALHEGLIDQARAGLIAEMTRVLSDEDARTVEALIFPKAGEQTTGQLRAALARAILAVDPEAAARRREEALKDPRVRRWQEDAGTAALAGFGLPPADVLAADQRLTGRAHALRAAGLAGTLEELRARAYLDTLLDRDSTPAPPPSPGTGPPPSAAGSGPGSPPGPGRPIDSRVTLTVPLDTGTGHGDAPGTVAGYGPVDGPLARDLLDAAAAHPASRFCITLTGQDGQAIGHSCLRGSGAWQKLTTGGLTMPIAPLARGSCDHRHQEPGYQPSRKLQHLIQARNPTCTAPGCQRPATRCDLDHTTPYDQGGRTCECDLAPLCRHHHRCKQAEGWRLEQPQPGVMIWTTPAGRHYVTQPDSYP